MNTREGERVVTDLAVTVRGPERGPIQARLRDVSLSGAGIALSATVCLDAMEPVELVISLPQGKRSQTVRIAGFVVRRDEAWMGVMFMDDAPWLASRLREAAMRCRSGGRHRPISKPSALASPLVAADS